MLLVAAANVYTSQLLLRQARLTGAFDYESLGLLVGGPWWQLFVEFSNWFLLFGTIVVRSRIMRRRPHLGLLEGRGGIGGGGH